MVSCTESLGKAHHERFAGEMLADTITVGNLTVPSQPMALATHFQGQWAAPWDGLMGMGCEFIHQSLA